MSDKVKTYLLGLLAEMEQRAVPLSEREEIHRFLKRLEGMGFINERERKHWELRFSGIMYEPIHILGLSARACNCLGRAGIKNCGQVRDVLLNRNTKGEKFLKMRNMGAVTATEIIKCAVQNGIVELDEIISANEGVAFNRIMEQLHSRQNSDFTVQS